MDGAPYMVNGDIFVEGPYDNIIPTLKIEPGTEVWFGSGSNLFIGNESNVIFKGALQAEGVTFTRSQGIETWPGIDIRNHSVDDNTYLNNCIIEYAIDGIYCQSSRPTLTNNIFRYNTDGVESDGGSEPTISNNIFVENNGGIVLQSPPSGYTIGGSSNNGNSFAGNVEFAINNIDTNSDSVNATFNFWNSHLAQTLMMEKLC